MTQRMCYHCLQTPKTFKNSPKKYQIRSRGLEEREKKRRREIAEAAGKRVVRNDARKTLTCVLRDQCRRLRKTMAV